MDFEVINKILTEALDKVLEVDTHLLIKGIHERAICHRLAVYLESNFPKFNIDCEYDGNVDADKGKKYITILVAKAVEIGKLKHDQSKDEFIQKDVIPDIIIHRRGKNGKENNLLVIEVKKSSNSDDNVWDATKLESFTINEYGNAFDYQYGAFIKFAVKDQLSYSIEWYQNGKKISV